MLGFEPFASFRDNYRLQGQDSTEEMQAYWLERGISLLNSAKVVLCKQRLEKRSVLARYIGGNQRLHAKIFVGDMAASARQQVMAPDGAGVMDADVCELRLATPSR